MKKWTILLACVALAGSAFVGCKKESESEGLMDSLKDTAEEAGKAAEDAADDASKAVEDATE